MSKFNASRVQDKEGGQKHHHFDQHKVRVLIPRQHDGGHVIVQGETETSARVKSQEHFTVTRHVINLDLSKEGVDKLDPPASIRIEMEPGDLQPGQTLTDVRMAYWNDATDSWEIFTAEKHNFRHIPASGTNRNPQMEAEIAKWGDPPVAIGHIPPSS